MKISILSAVWNEEKHIGETISSVVSQTHTDWELLFVDDGSTDATCSIILDWSERDDRVKLVRSGGKVGKCAAYNRAWKESDGDLICLLGGDDTLPPRSLEVRAMLLEPHVHADAVGLFKLRTFSEMAKYDGAVLPRGSAGSRSGGVMTMSRSVANLVFPIPESLPAEDIWLGHAVESVAEVVLHSADVVLNYRIHDGNSNPRHLRFSQMNESTHRRQLAVDELLIQQRFQLDGAHRQKLELLARAERYRYDGRVMRILQMRDLDLVDRLGIAQAADARLRWVRDRLYLLTSGWRGR